jgi:hypothetical protein
MIRQRLPGVLWLIAGLSSGAVAFFVTDPLHLAILGAGAALGILLGLAMLVRPSATWDTASTVLGLAWLVAVGYIALTNLSVPLEELLSVVWILGFGIAAAAVTYLRQSARAQS